MSKEAIQVAGILYAPANFLTNQALDPDGKIPELKYCAAKIQKLTA